MKQIDWPTMCRLGVALLFVVLGVIGFLATVIMCVLGHRSLFEGTFSILLDLIAIIGGSILARMYWRTLLRERS